MKYKHADDVLAESQLQKEMDEMDKMDKKEEKKGKRLNTAEENKERAVKNAGGEIVDADMKQVRPEYNCKTCEGDGLVKLGVKDVLCTMCNGTGKV